MKRFLVACLCLVVFLSCFALANAEDIAPKQSKLALDLAIVIDESGSMSYPENRKNDEYGYRHDAAAMLLGLCDSKQSRAALIPFSTTVVDETVISGVNRLQDIDLINNSGNRKSMIDLLKNEINDSARTYETLYEFSYRKGGQTDIGEALERAVNILTENPGNNRKVIVLLTDGAIELETTAEVKTSTDRYYDAVERSREEGIVIYTVALKMSDKNAKLLEDAATNTQGIFKSINTADDLPGVFNSFFADLMGSEVVSLEGRTEQIDNKNFRAVFNIPNLSIAEANILIPVGMDGSVRLFKPNNDKPVPFDGQKVIQYSTTYFTFLKIINPDTVGEWYVEYSGVKTKQLKGINVNVIFSYDIIPTVEVSPVPIRKNEKVTVDVRFKNSDGTYTNDANLYTGNINAVMSVNNDSTGAMINDIEMEKKADRFTYSFVPKDQFDGIRAGNMHFTFKLQGDGMDDTLESDPLPVKNQAPVLKEKARTLLSDIKIHDPRKNDYENEFEAEIDLTEYVTEPDDEDMTYAWVQPDGDNVIVCNSLENGKLKISTRNKGGECTLNLDVKDVENAVTRIQFPVKVTNYREDIAAEYSFKVTHTKAEKGEEFTFIGQLKKDDQLATDQEMLKLVDTSGLQIRQQFTIDDHRVEERIIPFTRDGNEFKANWTASVNECSYEIIGSPKVRDIAIKLDTGVLTMGNQAPRLTGKTDTDFNYVEIHDPEKEDYEEEKTCTLNLYDYITDDDGETLAFELIDAQPDGVFLKQLSGSELKLTTDNRSGNEVLHIRGTDPEGASVVCELNLEVKSIRDTIKADTVIHIAVPETVDKDTDYEITAEMLRDGKIVKNENLVSLLDLSGLQLAKNSADGQDKDSIPLQFRQEGNILKAVVHADIKSCVYTLQGKIFLRNDTQLKYEAGSCTVGNMAPVIMEEYRASLQETFSIEPFLWGKKDETTYDIDLKQLFTDSITDRLTYGAALVPAKENKDDPDPTVEELLANATELDQLEVSDGVLTLTNETAGPISVLLYAEDTDRQQVATLYTRDIKSQKNDIIWLLIMVAIGAVILTIVILGCYWGLYRKSWNRNHGSVSLSINNVPRQTNAAFPKRGKQDIMLASMHITDVASGDIRSSLTKLGSAYQLRAGKNGNVIVRAVQKNDSGYTVTVGTKPFSGAVKKITWAPKTTMLLSNNAQNTRIEIRRDDNQPRSTTVIGTPVTRTPVTSPSRASAPVNSIARPKL